MAEVPSLRELRGPASLLALLLLLTYAFFIPAPGWNETSRFALVRSLVERQKVDIDPYHHETGDKSRLDAHHYSDKAPGASLLAAPAYALYAGWLRVSGAPAVASRLVGGDPWAGEGDVLFNASYRRAIYVCNLFTNAVAGAVLGALFFVVLARAGHARDKALAATLALGLGSLSFPYATMFYGHVLAGTFLFGAFVALGPWLRARADAPPTRLALLVAGGLAGLAVLTELPAAIGAAVLLAYAFAVGRHRAVLLFAAGAAPAFLLLTAYNIAAFGGPLATGYAYVARPDFAAGMAKGLFGIGWPRPGVLLALLFGRSRGLFYITPVLILAFVGLGFALRRGPGRREMMCAAAIVAGFLLVSAGYYMWWGGAAIGPRHLIPALPFLCVGLAGLPWGERRPVRWLTWALLAVSIVNLTAATAVSPLAPPDGDLLRDHVWIPFLTGNVAILPGASNGGLALGLRGPASLLPLLVVWALAVPRLRRIAVPGTVEPAAPSG